MLTFQKYVHFMRTQFPPGSRVLLLSNDQPKPVPDGTMGTLTEVDAAGRFLVNWDTGKRTALNLEDDHFRIFQSDPMELKLYFPLHGDLYTRNEWGDLADDPVELTGGDLSPYLGDIREALQENQLPEEQERGLMHWYRESDALSWKVKSAFFDVELHDGQLWGVADCQLLESLEGDELGRLTTYLAGQARVLPCKCNTKRRNDFENKTLLSLWQQFEPGPDGPPLPGIQGGWQGRVAWLPPAVPGWAAQRPRHY